MTLLFLSGLSQFFFNEDYWIISELINNKSSSKSTFVTGFFGEEKKLGSFIARLSPLIIGLYLFISNKEMKKKINSALLYFTPLFLMGFFTSERMAMFYLSLTLFFLFIFLCFWRSYLNFPKSRILQTGGSDLSAISTKSNPAFSAIINAFFTDTMPACFPFSSIRRTLETVMPSLIRGSEFSFPILYPPSCFNFF